MSDKISLDPRALKIGDLKRAKAGPLEGRNPLELFDDPLESATLVVWCVRSRDDPEFTWADAEQAELGDFEQFNEAIEGEGEQPDPQGASPGEPSARRSGSGRPASTPKPPRPEPASSSATSSASTGPSTTP